MWKSVQQLYGLNSSLILWLTLLSLLLGCRLGVGYLHGKWHLVGITQQCFRCALLPPQKKKKKLGINIAAYF